MEYYNLIFAVFICDVGPLLLLKNNPVFIIISNRIRRQYVEITDNSDRNVRNRFHHEISVARYRYWCTLPLNCTSRLLW